MNKIVIVILLGVAAWAQTKPPRPEDVATIDGVVGRDVVGRILTDRPDASLFDIIEECERRIIGDMLEKCAWNQTEAAERFHIPLSTLNQKIKRLNIEIKKKGKEA